MKPKLLIVELWGLGDLIIATPIIRAAAERYDVTLLAKPFALDLRPRLWPGVNVVPFVAPWTAFKGKYRLWQWHWPQILRLGREFETGHFEWGLSARWDPRDHLILKLIGVKNRLGFPRAGSTILLSHPLAKPDPEAHRYEYWRTGARALGLDLPQREKIPISTPRNPQTVLIHSGAGQTIRVWPLVNYRGLAARLREQGFAVQIACDPEQRDWWLRSGESGVATPPNVADLIALTDHAGVFIGNDSGPGHLAAFCGVPTFTIFGPQVAEWFVPLHPWAEWMDGKVCPYMPCSDYCRYPVPFCIRNITEMEVWPRVEKFVHTHCKTEAVNVR